MESQPRNLRGQERPSAPAFSNCNGSAAAVATPVESSGALNNNFGISSEWSAEEQAIFDQVFTQSCSDKSRLRRYAKIASRLPNKTIRDVALRWRWMLMKRNIGRRKEPYVTSEGKDIMDRAAASSARSTQFAAQPNVAPDVPQVNPLQHDGVPHEDTEVGDDPIVKLQDQIAQHLRLLSANFATLTMNEMTNLIGQTRQKIKMVQNNVNNQQGAMRRMLPLPVQMNEELAERVLHRMASFRH